MSESSQEQVRGRDRTGPGSGAPGTSWWLYRLTADRRDFAATMTDEERATMGAHVAYWRAHLESGRVLVFSPVADPDHSWGLAIVSGDADELAGLRDADPAVRGGVGRGDFLLLPGPVLAGAGTGAPAPG